MSKTQKKIIVAEIVAGILFIFLVSFDILRKIPGFECESFGCIGNGIILLFIAVIVIPFFFGVVGTLAIKESRIRGGLTSFFSALVVMVIILVVMNIFDQIRTNNAVEESKIQEQLLLNEIRKNREN